MEGFAFDCEKAAVANTQALRRYLSSRKSYDAVVDFCGGQRIYFDLSDGSVDATIGGFGFPTGLYFHGPATLCGVNAKYPTTPLFKIRRNPGSIPPIILEDLTITTDGSGIAMINPGTRTRLDNVGIVDCTGYVPFEWEYPDGKKFYTDLPPFGLYVEEADGFVCDQVSVERCHGHGVVANRWHFGKWFGGRVGQCWGDGYVLTMANGSDLQLRAEGNYGAGLRVFDTGINRYSNREKVANDGAPNIWNHCWFEANGLCGNSNGTGFKFPQYSFRNCAGIHLDGHLGLGDLDNTSLALCSFRNDTESFGGDLPEPAKSFNHNYHEIVTPDRSRDARIDNWETVWTDQQYRPEVNLRNGTIEIGWPIHSLDRAVNKTAYWRPWGLSPLESPGTFVYKITVEDHDGNITEWAKKRIKVGALNCAATVCIAPIGGDITAINFVSRDKMELTGAIKIDDSRRDIGIDLNAFCTGMGEVGGVSQDKPHKMIISDLCIWRIG